jgi:hypothetical protein
MDESEMEADALADLADMKRADIDDHFGDYLQTSGLAESPDERHVADGGSGEDGWGGVGGWGGWGGVDGSDPEKFFLHMQKKNVGDDVHRGARGAEGMNEAQGCTDSRRRLEWYWEGGRGYWEGGREGERECLLHCIASKREMKMMRILVVVLCMIARELLCMIAKKSF